MNLLQGHRLAGSLCQAFKLRAPLVSPQQLLAMTKRRASALTGGPLSDLHTSSSPMASPTEPQPPRSKRPRLTHVAAIPPAASTTMAPPKAKAAAAGAVTVKGQSKAQPADGKAQEDGMWLIVGLGNPGANYEDTRHNIGFMVLDELARQAGIDCRKLEKSAAVGKGELRGKQVLLVKPVTFMNNSGESVSALARFYRVPPGRVLVISDDLDQPVAQVRLRQRGGHGGHNGLRSIIDRLGGTQDFPRIKIGIGRPAGQLPIASYVLLPFTKAEKPEIEVAVKETISIVESVLGLGLDKAASGQRL